MLGTLLDTIFPARCVGCGRPPAALCPACLARARPAAPAPPPAGVDRWVAAFAYEGAVREALARVKYRNARSPLPVLATALEAQVRAARGWPLDEQARAAGRNRLEGRLLRGAGSGGFDLVTWPPTTGLRRRQRGFDQAEHLARAVGRGFGAPVRPVLARLGETSQTGRSARERRRGPAFAACRSVDGLGILVVDDIATTGATLTAAARALRAAGALEVVAATVARTARKEA